MKNFILYGNCQAGALSTVFTETPAISERWNIVTHDLWADGETLEKNLRDFADAEIILIQDVRNWRRHPFRDQLPEGAKVIHFPFCYIAALWPFDSFVAGTDEAMVAFARAHDDAKYGRFPFGFQDAVLARLRTETPDKNTRYLQYRHLEFRGVPDLARYAEYEEARLLNNDRRLGFTMGQFMVDNYRKLRLFHAITHPAAPLIDRLAREVIDLLEIVPRQTELAPFDDRNMRAYQVPVHPEVIETLGLTWVTPQTRYNLHNQREITFEEYYRLYIDTL